MNRNIVAARRAVGVALAEVHHLPATATRRDVEDRVQQVQIAAPAELNAGDIAEVSGDGGSGAVRPTHRIVAMWGRIRPNPDTEPRGLVWNPEILVDSKLYRIVRQEAFANSAGASYAAEHTDFAVGAGVNLIRGTDILYAGHEVAQKKRQASPEEIAGKAIDYFGLAERTAPIPGFFIETPQQLRDFPFPR